MSDIFISYASADRDRARALAGVLAAKGWSVWWDRTIPPGKEFDQVIEDALDSAKSVVVLWSKSSVASSWVKTEAADAMRRKVLVPALIEQVKIPLEFRRLHAADLSRWQELGPRQEPETQQQLETLIQSIGMLVTPKVTTESSLPTAEVGERPEAKKPDSATSTAVAEPTGEPGRGKRKFTIIAVVAGIVFAGVAALGLYQAHVERIALEQAERAAKEQAAEQVAREQATKEQAAREQAAKEHATKEQAAKERATKEQAAKEQAAKEQAAREHAREQAAREQAAKEQAAKGQAAKSQTAREQAAKEQAAGDYSRVLLSKETGDTLRILEVFPRPGTRLISGQTTQLKFRLHYNLQSRERAILAMSIAQTFPPASSCASFNSGSGGHLVDASQALITRGERDIELSVDWRGGRTKEGIQPNGFLAPTPSLWDVRGNSDRGELFARFGTVTEACWTFTP